LSLIFGLSRHQTHLSSSEPLRLEELGDTAVELITPILPLTP